MKKLSHQFDKPKRSVASPEALEALRNNNAVRWYVLSLPDCHRGGVRGLQREQDRRIQAGEPSFGFFAPSYQEVRRIDGKFVNTQRPLLFNYVFVRASERDVFQLMQRFPVLSFLPRVRERKREYFPYLSDAAIRNGEFAVGGPFLFQYTSCLYTPAGWFAQGRPDTHYRGTV